MSWIACIFFIEYLYRGVCTCMHICERLCLCYVLEKNNNHHVHLSHGPWISTDKPEMDTFWI